MTTRRGVTLIELLVAVVVAMVLLTMAIRVQATVERNGRSRLERLGAAASLRAAAKLVRWEWAGFGFDSMAGADFAVAGPGRVSYRGQSGLLAVCHMSGDTLLVDPVRLAAWRHRLPIAGRDSLLVYLPGDSAIGVDAWLPAAVVSGPDPGVCPGGIAGVRYRVAWTAYAGPVAEQTVARSYESLELRAYNSAGSWQLGQVGLVSGGVVQPAVGPLAAGGFEILPVDGAGVVTDATGAAGLEIRLRILTGRETAVGPGRAPRMEDSLGLRIRLENVP